MRFVTIDASPASRSATPTRRIPSATCWSAADRRPCAIAKMPATSTQYSTKGRRLSKQSSTRKRRKRKPDCTKERRRRVQPPVPDRAAGEAKSRSPACLRARTSRRGAAAKDLGALTPRRRMIDTVHRVSSGVKDRGNNLKSRKPRGQRRRDLGQHCGGHQEEHQRRNPRHLRKGPHVDAIAPHEPLADRPAVTRAVVLLKLRERTPL